MKTRNTLALLLAITTTIPAAASTALAAGAPDAFAIVYADADKDKDKEKDKSATLREREEELYDDAQDALDEGDWRQASIHFRKVADMGLEHADSARYWLAYAQNKRGMRSEALATLVDLQKAFPKSKWASDGKALELEIRQSAGQTVSPENVDDEDIKLMAVNGLMNTDPARAIPLLEKILAGKQSVKVKERALFVLSQSSSPQALQILGRIAKGDTNRDLQSKALKYLGISGGQRSRAVLADVYASSADVRVKKSVLRSYMISGDKGRLLALAKTEPNAELRGEAISQLGILGAKNELSELYTTETSTELRKKMIQAMFIGGNAEKLAEIARNEKNESLRLTAIRNLGLLGGARTGQLLMSIYANDSSRAVREGVVEGLFLQSNAKGLIALARAEKDSAMKKEIIQKLSLIGSKEAADFLVEFLNELARAALRGRAARY